MIRAIAFDWGGVFTRGTFDSSAVRNLAALFGVPEEAVAAHYYPLMEEFEIGAFDLDTFHRAFVEAAGLQCDASVFRKAFLGSVRERPEMFDVLERIPKGYVVGMLSNNVPVLCDRVRSDPRMRRIPTGRFVFSNEIGVRKPDPAAFERLTEALGVPPEGTVFVDDSAENIAACERLGFTGIHIPDFEAFRDRWNAVVPALVLE